MAEVPVPPHAPSEFNAWLQSWFECAPDPYESFPRTYWFTATLEVPPFKEPWETHLYVERAAYEASEAWIKSEGDVDRAGFLLAVTAKAMEIYEDGRNLHYGVNDTLSRRIGRSKTFSEWQGIMDGIIDEGYDMAISALHNADRATPAPSRDETFEFCRGALDTQYRYPSDGAENVPIEARRGFDREVLKPYQGEIMERFVSEYKYPIMPPEVKSKLIDECRKDAVAAEQRPSAAPKEQCDGEAERTQT